MVVCCVFNYQARWDRDLPQDKDQKLGAPIAVICLMQNGRILPKSILWKNRTLNVQKINFHWKGRQGRDTMVYFSVKTEIGTYEIALSQLNLSWHINKLLSP